MPQNTRKLSNTQPMVEKWNLVSFPGDDTYGYFKANVCRATKEDPDIVKIRFKGKLWEAVILYTGSKNGAKNEARRLMVEVSCSSEDDDDDVIIPAPQEEDETDNEIDDSQALSILSPPIQTKTPTSKKKTIHFIQDSIETK